MLKDSDSHSSSSHIQDSILSLAAMFEGDFSLDWLEELAEMKASVVLSALEWGVQEGLLSRQRPAVYAFIHEETRSQYADQLTNEEKEQCHRKIAAILVRELPDDDSLALEVAQHFLCIPGDWRTCEWLVKAGEIYAKSFQAEKALGCFSRVLNELSSQRGGNEDRLFVKAAMGYSNVYAGRADMQKILSFLLEARERAKNLHEQSNEILLELHIAKYERLRSEFDKALDRFERAFSNVESLNNPTLTAAATVFHTYFLFWQGRFHDVIEVYEKSVPEVDRYPVGQFPIVAAMMVGHCYTMVGKITQGLGMLDAIYNYCLRQGDNYLSSHASACIAMVMTSINRFEDAARYLRLSMKEAGKSDNRWVSSLDALMLALTSYQKGNSRKALQYLHEHRTKNVVPARDPVGDVYLFELCWAMECEKLSSLPGLSLEKQIDLVLSQRNIFLKGIAYRYKALLGKLRGASNEEIVQLLTSSNELLKESGNQLELANTKLELARLYLSTGNRKKGKVALQAASDILSPIDAELIPDDLKPLIEDQNSEGTILTEILNLAEEMAAKQGKSGSLQQIVVTANHLIRAERGALLLADEDAGSLKIHLRASKNLTIEQINDPQFASSRKMIESVIASGKGQIFETDPSENAISSTGEIIRSSICVPVMLRKRIIGVLYHENRLLGSVFKESHLKLLAYLAAQAALSLDYEKVSENVEKLSRKNNEENLSRADEITQSCRVEGLVGTSRAMQHIFDQISRIARSDTTVLILGETGVGKNLVAEAIHRQSLRSNGPFVTVQCSALTESLITSELFGHEKGAFTGATNRMIGRFELANKGTLFLDEIGDLSLDVQARLLRVLQSKEFERVGGGKETLTSDFRLVAATNRNLEEDVRAKRFREDLYYRINVFPLSIPPLRERREDIPFLVNHFLQLYAPTQQGNIGNRVSREVIDALMRRDWPGNIRELQNVIQRGVVLSKGPHFQLPPEEVTLFKTTGTTGIETLEENERGHIIKVLQKTGWKVRGPGGAAEILNINPSTLRCRIKKLKIAKPDRRI